MCWRNQIFIDTCLPFGLRSAPKLFNTLADLLSWILEQRRVIPLLHYLNDFLLLGPPNSLMCQNNLTTVKEVRLQLGIPLALEKMEEPSDSLTFLGITLETQHMEVSLPPDKLQYIHSEVSSWLMKKKATKREILSLVGLLKHATKVVKPGHTFISWMYSTVAKVKKLFFYTRLTKDFWSDLQWWHMFVTRWNGVCFFQDSYTESLYDYQMQTDASGTWGCGACFNGQWFQLPWSPEWIPVNISGVAKVGNGWAQAQPIMFGAQPILMFTISFHTYTHAFSDEKIHYNALYSYHIATI